MPFRTILMSISIATLPTAGGCYSFVAVQPRELPKLEQPETVGVTTYPVIDGEAIPTTTLENNYRLVGADGKPIEFYGDPDAVEIETTDHALRRFYAPLHVLTPSPDQVVIAGAHHARVTFDWVDIQRARVAVPDDEATIAVIVTGSVLFVGACVALPFLL